MSAPPFDLLKILVATAESKNMVEAAKKLGVSQAAVSINLARLQRHSELPIFSLEGRRKTLTRYGRELYEIAREQGQQLDRRFEDLSRTYDQPENLTLRVGSRPEVFRHIAPRLMFKGRVEFTSLSGHESVTKLLDHSIDIAITYVRPDSTQVMAKKLFDSTSRFVIHKKWLPPGQKVGKLASDLRFLTQTPCLIFERDGHLLKDWLRHLGIDWGSLKKTVLMAQDWTVIQSLVDGGVGYAIVPSYLQTHNPEVVTYDIPDPYSPKLTYYALFEKDLRRVGAFKKILEFR